MKKAILVLTIGILLIAGNLYADGDLYVNGNLGVGTESPTAKLDVRGKTSISNINQRYGFTVSSTLDQVGVGMGEFIIGASYGAKLEGPSIGQAYGLEAVASLENTGPTAKRLVSASFTSLIGTDTAGNTDVDEVVGFDYGLGRRYNNNRTYSIINSYGIRTKISEGGTNNTAIDITNHYHHFIGDDGTGKLDKINIDNLTGMWIEQQTAGTNNFGIVLAGDDAGADIVFGPNQDSRIYSNGGVLWADDSFGSHTQISPHDPETGEWIFYSKNTKTGRTVRVNMEELVRDIEKLTGKKYMIESFVEALQKSAD